MHTVTWLVVRVTWLGSPTRSLPVDIHSLCICVDLSHIIHPAAIKRTERDTKQVNSFVLPSIVPHYLPTAVTQPYFPCTSCTTPPALHQSNVELELFYSYVTGTLYHSSFHVLHHAGASLGVRYLCQPDSEWVSRCNEPSHTSPDLVQVEYESYQLKWMYIMIVLDDSGKPHSLPWLPRTGQNPGFASVDWPRFAWLHRSSSGPHHPPGRESWLGAMRLNYDCMIL